MKFLIRSHARLGTMLLCCVLCYQCFAQERTLRGYTFDERTFEPVPLANITVTGSTSRFISNRKGFFRISLNISDSVYISGIGYESKGLRALELVTANPDDTTRIFLRPVSYRLKDVNVVYSNRKRDSIARLAAEFMKNDPLLNNYDRVLNRTRPTEMNPLSLMYEEWSKEGQDMRRFEEFLRYAEQQKVIDRRFNRKIAKKVTGLPEDQMDDFMMFCKPGREFIITAHDYDLLEAIKKCGEDFRGKVKKERTRLR